MKPSFIPLASFAFEVFQSKGEHVPCFIHLPHMEPNIVETYGIPPYSVSEMFILCGYVAQTLGD